MDEVGFNLGVSRTGYPVQIFGTGPGPGPGGSKIFGTGPGTGRDRFWNRVPGSM